MSSLPNYFRKRNFEMPEKQQFMRLKKGSFSCVDFKKDDGTLVAKEWFYCREYFHNYSQGIRSLLFCHIKCRGKNIAAFINRVEEMVGVSPRSKFGPTQRYDISWIKISPWWSTTSMRRSLFTILIRCGQFYNYRKDNFDEALLSSRYTRQTEFAVRRFLSGHTKYTGRQRGWYRQFRFGSKLVYRTERLPDEDVCKLLVMP